MKKLKPRRNTVGDHSSRAVGEASVAVASPGVPSPGGAPLPSRATSPGARVEPGPGIVETAVRWWDDIENVHGRLAAIPSPYGDGTASEQTVAAIEGLVA